MRRKQGHRKIKKNDGERTARTTTSTPPSMFDNPITFATQVAKLVVSSVVVLEFSTSQPSWDGNNVVFRSYKHDPNDAGAKPIGKR